MEEMNLYITRIIRGGIYFLRLPRDDKMRPYLVVSNESGYGKNVLTFCISSKYASSDTILPVLLMGRISFIRASSVIEVSPKQIHQAEFAGVVPEKLIELTVQLFMERLLPCNEEEKRKLREEIENYLDLLERNQYVLYRDTKTIFTKKEFLDNVLARYQKASIASNEEHERKYPFQLSDWSFQSLQEFRIDQFRLPKNALMAKYDVPSKRVDFLKGAVKKEIARRKGDKNEEWRFDNRFDNNKKK